MYLRNKYSTNIELNFFTTFVEWAYFTEQIVVEEMVSSSVLAIL